MPKHSFILWVAGKHRLLTKDRVKKFKVMEDLRCVLSEDQDENLEHLFFKCPISSECLEAVRKWLDWWSNSNEIWRILRWIQRAKMTRFRKQVFLASVAGLVYCIWQQRNRKLWQQSKVEGAEIVKKVKALVKMRVNVNEIKCKEVDCKWSIEL